MSAQHLLVVAGPAVLASLPVIFILVWISNAYGYQFPAPGTPVDTRVLPESAAVVWQPAIGVTATDDGGYRLAWPAPEAPVRLLANSGEHILSLPPPAPVPVVHKRQWWNALMGNPAGYLPADAPLDEIKLDLPAQTYISFGPAWTRSWELTYFLILIICSLAIKIVFKIH